MVREDARALCVNCDGREKPLTRGTVPLPNAGAGASGLNRTGATAKHYARCPFPAAHVQTDLPSPHWHGAMPGIVVTSVRWTRFGGGGLVAGRSPRSGTGSPPAAVSWAGSPERSGVANPCAAMASRYPGSPGLGFLKVFFIASPFLFLNIAPHVAHVKRKKEHLGDWSGWGIRIRRGGALTGKGPGAGATEPNRDRSRRMPAGDHSSSSSERSVSFMPYRGKGLVPAG